MKRTIKFRGKRADNGKWVYGDLIHGVGYKYGNSYILPNQQWLPKDCDPLDGYKVIPETLGDFTGLTDCNGKEIYEGDIVITYWGNDYEDKSLKGVVTWDKAALKILIHGREIDYFNLFNSTPLESYEVIGNIHDNPELIQQSTDRGMTKEKSQRILHLVLKRKWWDIIESGEKTDEYRGFTRHWFSRLVDCARVKDADLATRYF